MATMKISEILDNASRISGFGGQITEDNLLDFVDADTSVDTTLTRAGIEALEAGAGLERGKFEFLIPVRGIGWITAFTEIRA